MFREPNKKTRWSPAIVGLILACLNAFGADPVLESRTVAASTKVTVGVPFSIEYIVEWQGARDACVVLPLEAPVLDWAQAELRTARTEQDGDRWRVVQVVEYRAATPGKYSVTPLEVEVITSNQPIVGAFESTPSTKVKMDAVPVTVVGAGRWKLGAGMLAATTFAAVVLGALALRRRRAAAHSVQESDALTVCRDLLHEARRFRLDGDLYGCYQALLKSAEALQAISRDAKSIAVALQTRIPAVGFQGVRPTDDETDGFFRDLERIIARQNTLPAREQEA